MPASAECSARRSIAVMPCYAGAITLGAFLLFQVQPLIGKYILPWFGGGPGVWTSCLLFFQLGLLGGYVYAHVLRTRFKPRVQAAVHCVLLGVVLFFMPIIPGESWKPEGSQAPNAAILGLLAATVGLPYMLLAATGPLLQSWLSHLRPETRVYRLYALSNAASVTALLSYPVFFEAHWTRQGQAWLWSGAFIAYAVLCMACACLAWHGQGSVACEHSSPGETELRPSAACVSVWALLASGGTILLIATTNKLCQDVAVVPFLWVAPLTAYLASFIVAFDSPRWYARFPFTILLCASLTALCWISNQGTSLSIAKHVLVYCGALFVCSMVCHGELYRLRPGNRWLTHFYLAISAGGALGGVFVALIAPKLFNTYLELPVGMMLCATLFLLVCAWPDLGPQPPPEERNTWRLLGGILPLLAIGAVDAWLTSPSKGSQGLAALAWIARIAIWALLLGMCVVWVWRWRLRSTRYWRIVVCLWLSVGWVALASASVSQAARRDPDMLYRSRNFYGVLTVYEHRRDDPLSHHMLLQHGGITHGIQFVDRDQRTWPVSYYSSESGVGKALSVLPPHTRRVGVVGLGTGTMAAYGKIADYFRFYEINPEIEKIARSQFTYLADTPALVDVVLGDARLSMEREIAQQFDLLVLDAFSSDAIPVHLLTREAFAIYDFHLRDGGIIAVHISNHYLNLEPVVRALAREFRFFEVLVEFDEQDEEWWNYTCSWMLLTRNNALLEAPTIRAVLRETPPAKTPSANPPRLWTDDFSSLYQILQ